MYYLFKIVGENKFKFQAKSTKRIARKGPYKIFEGPVGIDFPVIVNGELVNHDGISTLTNAYKEMDEGVIADSAPVFKTTNRESMLAFVDDFQLHIMVPEMFINDGEETFMETSSFPDLDTALDDAIKIKAFYSEVLYALLQKRRMRIRKYLLTKAQLGL